MRRLCLATVLVLLVSAPVLAAGPSATVSDLAWMTGNYKGALGGGSLEENWAKPEGGSIAALVRGTAGDATNMIELIVVEEDEGSLTLRVKQWNPGMEERDEGFQVMKLIEIGDQKVVFENVGDTGMQKLGYTRDGSTFTISVTTAQGSFDIPLQSQSPH